MRTSLVAGAMLLGMAGAAIAEANRYHLAEQSSWGDHLGFYLSFENEAPGDAACSLAACKLVLGVADGTIWRFIVTQPGFTYDRDYQVKAVIAADHAELWLDGAKLGESAGGFKPFHRDLAARDVPSWAAGRADYLVRQNRLTLAQGESRRELSLDQPGAAPLPMLLFDPHVAARLDYPLLAEAGLTIETTFLFVHTPDLTALLPVIDPYGQCRLADWPGKVTSDDDLRADLADEERELAAMPPSADFDEFGGWLRAGWQEQVTGYFHVTRRDGVFWLVTPSGNPCFYVGLSSIPSSTWPRTPVAGRERLFQWLPPRQPPWTAAWFGEAWGDRDAAYVCFHTANLLRKYGAEWEQRAVAQAVRRLKAWGFSGGGKWGAPAEVVSTPVLRRWGTPNLVRHPDIFDPAVAESLKRELAEQIAPRTTDPRVLGWSVGNEFDEVVTLQETRDILAKPAATPARKALLDHALAELYGGSLERLGAAWKLDLKERGDLDAATDLQPTDADLEALRRCYAGAYYEFLYRAVKEADPNHLYLGFWLTYGWWQNENDWRLIARHCDVLGYDRYAFDLTDERLDALLAEADQPVLCGEFSFPPFYHGERGFGEYRAAWSNDDADAGEWYRKWVEAAARNPYLVGVQWFQYRDQPLTGRGPGHGPELVYGEHYAFGVITETDRPKWELVKRMRETNLQAAGWRAAARP